MTLSDFHWVWERETDRQLSRWCKRKKERESEREREKERESQLTEPPMKRMFKTSSCLASREQLSLSCPHTNSPTACNYQHKGSLAERDEKREREKPEAGSMQLQAKYSPSSGHDTRGRRSSQGWAEPVSWRGFSRADCFPADPWNCVAFFPQPTVTGSAGGRERKGAQENLWPQEWKKQETSCKYYQLLPAVWKLHIIESFDE